MATKIVTKNSSTAGAAPTATDLVQGELAVNVTDKRLYTENNAGAIVELGTNPSTIDINAGTIDGTVIGGTTAAAISGTTGQFGTSLNVDGTVTADGLTVDGNDSYTSNIKFDYGASAPTYFANWGYKSSSDGNKVFLTITDAGAAKDVLVANYNGNVGIGITPATLLDIKEGTAATDAIIGLTAGTGGRAQIRSEAQADNTSSELSFHTMGGSSTSERMRISSSGNVGIGTSSPSAPLDVVSASSSTGMNIRGRSSDNIGSLYFTSNASASTEYGYIQGRSTDLRIQGLNNGLILQPSSGNVGIGVSPSFPFHLQAADGALAQFSNGVDADCTIRTASGVTLISPSTGTLALGTSSTERMRIDSSGNLLVGKSGTSFGTAGIEARAGGTLWATASETNAASFNRLSTDGPIAYFNKDGTTVGSIGVLSNRLYAGTGDTGLFFSNTTNGIHPWNTTSNSARDAGIDLGSATRRFVDIYATNGTIQTSDRNEKQDIAELSGAEQRVAVACKGLLRKFRWKDSVAEKGDEARTHFGIIAQDLQAAFAAEGLDAGDYAMFISTTWTDEETNEEKTRMGVRYSELLAFIIAAI